LPQAGSSLSPATSGRSAAETTPHRERPLEIDRRMGVKGSLLLRARELRKLSGALANETLRQRLLVHAAELESEADELQDGR